MWTDWSPATCLPDHCFCEGLREGAIRQPANTWSSLAFCVAGVVMALELRRRPGARGLTPLQAGCLAAAAVVVGAGSAFYHASLTFLGQWLDVEGMYLLALVPFAANVDALRPGAPKRFLALYVGLNLVMGVLLVTVPFLRRYAFAGAILAIIVTEVLLRLRKLRDFPLAPLSWAVGLMAVAFVIWILDLTRVLCTPESLLQGHAAWHVLGAVAAYFLWRYYRQPELKTL
jgi:Ceramidase